MPSLDSQANTTSLASTTSTGTIAVGEPASWFGAGAGAIRFAMPEDWGGGEVVHDAILTIRARGDGGSGSWVRTRVGVLDSASQVLPTTHGGITSAPMLPTGIRSVGAYSPPGGADHNLDGTYTLVNIDLTAAVAAAATAGHTDGGYIVILFQPWDDVGSAYLQVDGIGNTTPPSLYLDYSESGPPGPGRGPRIRRLFPCGLFPSRLFAN